jgi:hypothetical protein
MFQLVAPQCVQAASRTSDLSALQLFLWVVVVVRVSWWWMGGCGGVLCVDVGDHLCK